MRLVITSEERFGRTPDGAVWTSAQGHCGFWQRYLAVFDEVAVVARVRSDAVAKLGEVRADGEGVSFIAVPYYHGPRQYARQFLGVRNAVRSAARPGDAVILRVAGQIANVMAPALDAKRLPYGVEVISDPYDMFAPGAVRHPLRAWFRWSYTRAQRQQVARAVAASYVTERALQERYPARPGASTTHASSVELPDAAFRASPAVRERATTLVTVGSFAHMYKGMDVLVQALRRLHDQGVSLRLAVIGDGRHRPGVEAMAAELGVGEAVDFLGQLGSSIAVREQVDRADVFVLASRTEGLPRAIIEAMARGLPCVGTRVGGIPELLPDEDLVAPGDPDALARRIAELVGSSAARRDAGSRNLAKAREYHEDVLNARRYRFWSEIRELTRTC
jgi:glycosyltransferase involved in cell wall biosynthesis